MFYAQAFSYLVLAFLGHVSSSIVAAEQNNTLARAKPDILDPNNTTNATSTMPKLDPIDNVCYRWFQQSTMKNNSLYIDGGLETFATDKYGNSGKQNATYPRTWGYNYDLLKLDLTQAWDWKKQDIPIVALNKTANPATGSPPPQVVNGALFQGSDDDSKIYLYGGTTNWFNYFFPDFQLPQSATYSLWSFDTESLRWNQYDTSLVSRYRPAYGFSAEAPDLGLAFYYNGEIDSGSSEETQGFGDTVKIFLQGMMVLNTTDQTAVNISTQASSGTQPRTRGGAVYIPDIGGSGIVTFFGGTHKSVDELDSVELTNFVPLDQIDVFDVGAYLRDDGSRLWYNQTATGDIPEPRAQFCTVLASAPDNSSHNVYLYSGMGEDKNVFDDVFVLSLPSFTWTKVNNGTSPRYGHTCHRIGDQMLTVGGTDITDLNSTCDWEYQGVGILNISSVQWGSVFRPESETAPYAVPEKLQASINMANGTALKIPRNGWTDPDTGALFGQPVPKPKSRTLSKGAIAGIVVGAVVGATLVAAGGWYFVRQTRRSSAASDTSGEPLDPVWQPPDRQQTQMAQTMQTAQNTQTAP